MTSSIREQVPAQPSNGSTASGFGPSALGAGAYEAIFLYSLDGVMFTAPDGRIFAANPAACQLLGRSEREICQIGRQGLADATDPRWAEAIEERARTGRTRARVRMVRRDGSAFEVDLSSATFRTADGETRACVIFHDVSDQIAADRRLALMEDRDRIARNLHDTVVRRLSAAASRAYGLLGRTKDKAAHDQLMTLTDELDQTLVGVREAVFRLGSETERRYQSLVENSPVSVAVYRGSDTRFLYANRRAVELYGARDLDDMLSRHGYEVIPESLQPGWRQRVQAILDGTVIRQGRTRIVRFDGRQIDVEVNATRVMFDGVPCVQVELRDISRRSAVERRRRQRLQQELRTDPLTGLLNRRGWDAALAEGLAVAQASRAPFVVALADLDHFKAYNDTHGHPAGDHLLQQLARAWQFELRGDDVLARLGGEEFGLALPGTSLELADTLLARLHAGVPFGQTTSIGVAQWDSRETVGDLVARADRALYDAKRAGRNRTITSQPGTSDR